MAKVLRVSPVSTQALPECIMVPSGAHSLAKPGLSSIMESPLSRTPVSLPPPAADRRRVRAVVLGLVQGVGFRPFVYRLATELRLGGCVTNTSQGVMLEVEGPAQVIS